jgi:hypothetical protein
MMLLCPAFWARYSRWITVFIAIMVAPCFAQGPARWAGSVPSSGTAALAEAQVAKPVDALVILGSFACGSGSGTSSQFIYKLVRRRPIKTNHFVRDPLGLEGGR